MVKLEQFVFDVPLTASEAKLLFLMISWRRGAKMSVNAKGETYGCIADPRDVSEFCMHIDKPIAQRIH